MTSEAEEGKKVKAFLKSTTGKILAAAVGILLILAVAFGILYFKQNGWSEDGDNIRYLRKGKALTGFQTIDGKDYIFSDNHRSA